MDRDKQKQPRGSLVITTVAVMMFLQILAGTVDAAPPRQASFKWKKVPGAIAYSVQISNLEGKILIRRNTQAPAVNFRLPYGTYRGRVAAINKFQKTSRWSKWFNFTIKRSLKPEFDSAFPDKISPEDGKLEVTVKGDNFMENLQVKLLKNGKELKNISFVRKSFERIVIPIDSESLPGGFFDLAIINPGDNSIVAKQIFQVTANPEVDHVSPSRLNQTDEVSKITIKGKRFLKGCSAFFRKGSTMIRPRKIIRKDTTTLELTLDPSKNDSGLYDLVVMNPGDNNAVVSDSFRIFNTMGIYFGFSPVISFPGFSSVDSNFLGGHFYVTWNPLLFEDIPVVNIMGIESEFIYMNFKNEVNNSYDLVTFNYGLGLTFTFEITNVFHVILRGGGGLTQSTIKDTALGDLKSNDPYLYGGGSIRFNIADMVFLETGVQYYNIFYISKNFDSLLGLLRVGVVF